MNIEKIMDKNFRGVIYLVQNSNILYEKASGYADLPNEIPNTLDTKFASAFAGKVFVAVGILQLIEQGKLSFEDTLEMLRKQSGDGQDAEKGYYGYGVWIIDNPKGRDFAYFQGCDPGVSFLSEYNPNNGMISVLVSNYGDNVWREMRKIRERYRDKNSKIVL